MIKKVCVYCGSKQGSRPDYTQTAAALGKLLATRSVDLVYGAGSTGMMGALADAVLQAGGRAIGVHPKIFGPSVIHQNLTELHVVESMHDRKKLMFELSDAMIALPGGIGTFEELLEVFTWSQLCLHKKPVGILNICGYYDKFVDFLRHACTEGFFKQVYLNMLLVDSQPDGLFEKLENYEAPELDRSFLVEDVVD